MTTKTEKAIDFIAKQGTARSLDISKASGIPVNQVCSILYLYVKAGVLVSCRVEQPGKSSCNEYRLGGHVPADAWRDFKINVFSSDKSKKKQILPPAPTPADRPQVSVNNSGSTQVVPPATGRAVTDKKPHRKASQPAPGAGGHVDEKASWSLRSDGSMLIMSGGQTVYLAPKDIVHLSDFLGYCDGAIRKASA